MNIPRQVSFSGYRSRAISHPAQPEREEKNRGRLRWVDMANDEVAQSVRAGIRRVSDILSSYKACLTGNVRSRTVEDVAMERYGNLDDFQEAVEERRALDEKESRRSARRGANPDGSNSRSESNASGYGTPGSAAPSRRYVFTTDEGASSRPSSRAGFRRPGEDGKFDDVGTRRNGSPVPAGASVSTPTARPKGTGKFDTPKSSTPIPSVLTPHHLLKRNPLSSQAVATTSAVDPTDPTASTSPLTASELNVLQAKVLKARLMDDPEADELEAKYNKEAKRSREHAGSGGGDAGNGFWQGSPSGVEGQMGREADGSRTEVQVLPTLDIHGRLYDIGTSSGVDEQKILPGNRKPNLNKKVCPVAFDIGWRLIAPWF